MKFVCVQLNIYIGINVIPEHSVQRLVQARLGKDWMQERTTTLQQTKKTYSHQLSVHPRTTCFFFSIMEVCNIGNFTTKTHLQISLAMPK